ncbi:adhesion G protein-coupled receptor F4 [Paroedura picta]|uniref:adhesion G protein-coupled receptor F4 n=1 Tax=Paroedura picta TaxID=143630 RepID=UPI0040569972
MFAQQLICPLLVIFCATWISLGEPQTKGEISKNRLKAGSQQEKCVGHCHVSGKDCTEPCDRPLHGKMTFACPGGWWQKSEETCASLDVQSLLKRVSRYEVHPYSAHGSVAGARDGRFCTADFSCIIGDVLSAEPVAGNIVNIVMLLQNLSSDMSADVTVEKLRSYSKMANHILDGTSLPNWAFVSEKNASSILLESVISFAGKLQIGSSPPDVSEAFITTQGARINRGTPKNSFTFSLGFNGSKSRLNGTVSLPREGLLRLPADSQVITVAFPTLGPIIEKTLSKGVSVNGMVLSAVLPKALEKVSLAFEKMNKTVNSLCVAWHSAHRRWDETACELEDESPAVVTCRCHQQPAVFQSFSILMSPVRVKHPALHFITGVGLVVSIGSLVLCLAIEAAVWRQTTQTHISYMRHVCLVNIAASLLIADILFIIATFVNATPRNYDGCVTATFFVHFFYLALFFWMLALGLLILYGLLVIFRHLRKSTLLAVAFGIGYGCPTVIALLTVVITEPRKGYLRDDACWLNWNETKALLAFVIPALLIVGVNLVVVVVVLVKSGRSSIGDRSKTQDLVTVIRVSKNLLLLTPLLGLTWGFGLAVVHKASLAFHIVFSVLNAFQGFFILLLGTLLDRKTRESLRMKCCPSKTPSSDTTL